MAYKFTDTTTSYEQEAKQKASIFLREIAEEIVKTSTPKTPKRQGFLRRDVLKEVLGLKGKVVWSKNYAAKMEEIQFRNYTTPGTGPHYAEDAVKKVIESTGMIAKRVGLV